MTTLRYPSDFQVGTPRTDYIQFHAVRKRYLDAVAGQGAKYDYHPTSVILNVPQKVVENYSQNWNNAALGAITPELIGTISKGATIGDFVGSLGAAMTAGGSLFADYGLRQILEMAASGMQELGASGITTNGILSAAGGIVFNPNLEVLYEGPNFRTFNFQFAMFNKSDEDAQEIYKIIEWFRTVSVPAKNHRNWNVPSSSYINGNQANSGSGRNGSFGLGTNGQGWPSAGQPAPGTFDVFGNAAVAPGSKAGFLDWANTSKFLEQPPLLLMTFMRGATDHPFMRPLLPAAINSVSVDYTPTGNYTVMNNFGETSRATTVAATVTIQITERTNLTVEDLTEFESKAGRGTSKEYRAPKG